MAKKAAKRDREADKPAKVKAPKAPTQPVYTVIAFVTLVAMIVGCTLLYLDFEEYGGKSPAKESPPTLPKLGDEPGAKGAT